MNIQRITENTRIADFAVLSKVIICNKSTHLELYDLDLTFIKRFTIPFYANKMVKYLDNKIILVGSEQYTFVIIDYNIQTQNANLVFKKNIKHRLLEFTGYFIWTNILILHNNKTFKQYKIQKESLLENDLPSDIDFFTTLDWDFSGNTFNILVRDIEDITYILRYNKLCLTKKIKKACTSVFSYNQGYIYISEGTVWYEINNKKVAESEFGNTKVICSVIYQNDLILSMFNDELIKITVENKNAITVDVFKMNTFSNLYVVGNNILGHTTCGTCHLFNLTNNKIEVKSYVSSISNLNKCYYDKKMLHFYNSKYKSVLSNFQKSQLTSFKECINLVSFYIFNNVLIEVYKDSTMFKRFKEQLDVIIDRNIDFSPLDYSARGFYEYEGILHFYSDFYICKMSAVDIQTTKISGKILLCSFNQNKYVCYTADGVLQTMNSSKKQVDVSCILYYNESIYVSTYTNILIVYDQNLNIRAQITFPTCLHAIVHNNKIYFIDYNNVLYVYEVENEHRIRANEFKLTENEFRVIGTFNNVKQFISAGHLFLLSKYTTVYDTTNEQKNSLNIKDIDHVHLYDNTLYVLVSNNIYMLNLDVASYNYIHDNNNFSYINKSGNKKFCIYFDGTLQYNKYRKKFDILKKLTNQKDIKGEYEDRKYVFYTNDTIFRFDTCTKILSQELTNKKCIKFSNKLKIYYDSICLDKDVVEYKNGVIASACVRKDLILLIDYFQGFSLFDSTSKNFLNLNIKSNEDYIDNTKNEVNTVDCTSQKYYSGYIWNEHIILSDDCFLTVWNRQTNKVLYFRVEDKIVCYSEDSLEIGCSVLYCLTEGNAIWKLYSDH